MQFLYTVVKDRDVACCFASKQEAEEAMKKMLLASKCCIDEYIEECVEGHKGMAGVICVELEFTTEGMLWQKSTYACYMEIEAVQKIESGQLVRHIVIPSCDVGVAVLLAVHKK